jgi:hypothetical protein
LLPAVDAGYPFDIVASPTTTSSSGRSSSSSGGWFGRLLAYAAASYHLPLLIGFSVADRGEFVWGGAMVLRAAELHKAAVEEAAAASNKAAAAAAGDDDSCKPNILQVGAALLRRLLMIMWGFCSGEGHGAARCRAAQSSSRGSSGSKQQMQRLMAMVSASQTSCR